MLKYKVSKFRELKVQDENNGIVKFSGYGNVFGNVDSYGDVVVNGAFAKTISEKQGKFPHLFMHDPKIVVGAITHCAEDSKGLYIEGEVYTTFEWGKMVAAGMRSGSINEFSIGYQAIIEEFDRNKGINYLKEIKLYEISSVTSNFAANSEATLTDVKNREQMDNLVSVLEQLVKVFQPVSTTETTEQPVSTTIQLKEPETDEKSTNSEESTYNELEQLLTEHKIKINGGH